jgi:pyruvate/2-oxoglutarate/acetoin dehydrogenase E1 component
MKEYTFREVIAQAMSEEMRKDQSIYLMGEEVAFKILKILISHFSENEKNISNNLYIIYHFLSKIHIL